MHGCLNSGVVRLPHCLPWQPASPTVPKETAHFSLVLGMCLTASEAWAGGAGEQMLGSGSSQVSLKPLGSMSSHDSCLQLL